MIYGVLHYRLDIQSRNYDTFLSNNQLRQVIRKLYQEFVISLCGIAKVFRKATMNLNYHPDYKLFGKVCLEKYSTFKEE